MEEGPRADERGQQNRTWSGKRWEPLRATDLGEAGNGQPSNCPTSQPHPNPQQMRGPPWRD